MDLERFNPNEVIYNITSYFCGKALDIAKFCGVMDVKGIEKVNEDNYLIFASNHQSLWDIVILETILMKYLKNKKIIPAPTYRGFFEGFQKKWIAPILVYHGGFPIYSKKESIELRNKSLDEAVNSLLKQKRLVIFPEGKRNLDGRVKKGRLGIADIAIRAYAALNKEPVTGVSIVPVNIYYRPKPGIPIVDIKKIVVSFSDPIQFSEDMVCNLTKKESCSKENLDNEQYCKNCKIKISNLIMDRIKKLTTVNIEQMVSHYLIHAANSGKPFTKKNLFESLNKSKIYLKEKNSNLDYGVENFFDEGIEKSLKKIENRGILSRIEETYKLDKEKFLKVPEYKKIRSENVFLYYKNSIDHLLEGFEY